MSGTGSRLNLEPQNVLFLQYFKNIYLVKTAFLKNYVEVCEARKDHSAQTLSKGGNLELEHGTSLTAWIQIT